MGALAVSDILNEDELCSIADAWHRRKLAAWLDKNQIPYVLAASGWPRVHRKALEQAMGVRNESIVTGKPVEFDFGSLK